MSCGWRPCASFWADDEGDFPATGTAIWWEVWLILHGEQSPWDSFRMLAQANGMETGTDTIRFLDRVVGLAYGTPEQFMASAGLLDMIGELRRAKKNPADFIGLAPKEQAEKIAAMLPRVTAPPPTAPAVCLFDGGVVENPLVRPALDPGDCHRFDPNWPLADTSPHGTEMAGVILYGDRLAELLDGTDSVALRHRLESVKVLPPRGSNEPRLYGHITAQATSRVEIAEPERKRSFCMPLTTDGRDRGRPSSWSGVVDQLCASISDQNPRLFFVSAGNSDPDQRHRYPDSNDTDNVAKSTSIRRWTTSSRRPSSKPSARKWKSRAILPANSKRPGRRLQPAVPRWSFRCHPHPRHEPASFGPPFSVRLQNGPLSGPTAALSCALLEKVSNSY